MMTDRQEIGTRLKKQNKQQRLNVIVMIVGAAVILAAILMIPLMMQFVGQSDDFVQPTLNHRPMQNGNTMGDPNAPVIIEEFSDFTCAHCRTFAITKADEIAVKYVSTGQVYFVFNSVGNMLGHPNSILSAEAAYCAGDQNRFWEFHDLLYANQPTLFANINRNLDKSMVTLAESLVLDMARFKSCMDQDKYKNVIQSDQIDAFQAGIEETPSFVINGELFSGNWVNGELEAAIEAALADANQ